MDGRKEEKGRIEKRKGGRGSRKGEQVTRKEGRGVRFQGSK